MKIILFNGPPRSGKDTAADAITYNLPGVIHTKFAKEVKEGAHEHHGLGRLAFDYFEKTKETPMDEFGGMTPRQAYIDYSENIMKPKHGEGVFGKMTADYITKFAKDHPAYNKAVISDSGFASEAEEIIKAFGVNKILLVHVVREGFTFEGDSRSYIDLGPHVNRVTLFSGDANVLTTDAIMLARWFFGRHD